MPPVSVSLLFRWCQLLCGWTDPRRRATLPPLYISMTRDRAKTLTNLEVAFEACTQSFGTQTLRTRLEDRHLAAPRFSYGF